MQSIHPAIAAFKRIFPQSTAARLHLQTGASLSFCDKVLSGAKQPGAPMLEALLRSDVGKDVLIAVMGAAKPAWWVGYRRHLELSELVKAESHLRKQIEAMQRDIAD
ncbi:hypothetical protein [Bradyrhizobium uaiense]|uniref:Uncharacterized protein n=1 Tax=Bradyrhizobium uaiense TaxID=2594946 RepID=A0A6P1B9D3_9BRAD|nr:hypothetical protein [Bradyrhizobium uaiense]NEU95076.1 hypothetical protein [Bradyrhizobium uaiense]